MRKRIEFIKGKRLFLAKEIKHLIDLEKSFLNIPIYTMIFG